MSCTKKWPSKKLQMTQNVHYVRRAVLAAAAVLPEILENGTKNDKWDCISYHLTLLSYYYTFCKKFLGAQQLCTEIKLTEGISTLVQKENI